MTHADLCKIALAWLLRPPSRGGHGCKVAIDECATGWGGEIPDAIGFVSNGGSFDGTVLVECKTSRADFLADKKKPHRADGGVGNWRYFLAPTGLLKAEELPEKWGLVEINPRGHLKVITGAYSDSNMHLQRERLAAMHHESDRLREQFLVVRMLSRVSDPDKIIDMGKERNRLATRVNELVADLEKTKRMLATAERNLARQKELFGMSSQEV